MNERVLALAEALRGEGVRGAFGVPGSGLSWQLISALEGLGVPFTGVRHEGAGAIMAGAFGRVTGTLGCSITIKGPGLANAFPGVVSNHYEQWAAISVAEAFGPATPAARMHKRLDHRAVLSAVVKAYASPGEPDEVVRRLAAAAREEVPGPVHLELFAEQAPERFDALRPASHGQRREWSDALPPAVERAVASARRPVVIAGSLATRQPWGARLAELRVPVFTTAAAKGVLDERSPFAAGVYTGDGKALAPETRILPDADLVVGLGLRNLEVLSPKPFAAPLVIVDAAGPETANGFAPAEALTGAASEDFDRVLAVLAGREWGSDRVAEAQRDVRAELTAREWLPGRVFERLAELRPRRLTVDTGSFCTVAEHVWPAAPDERQFLASANGRYMGTAIPMALGAACADPSGGSICALGDGGMMYAAELKMAVERSLPVLFVLMTDGRYGSIACAPSAPGLDLDAVTMRQPSWYRAVQGLGMPAARASNLAELEDAVAAWGAEAAGPMFVEAAFDPEPYAAMTARVR
ncbi:MAG TPA: thiamine pyrophosphate-dependent enzyme [Gemmatimonadaceae bacterium]|nr:thiamine pyrophosphate-dependent enzyme [Gemmatimonadaceae bacterium]